VSRKLSAVLLSFSLAAVALPLVPGLVQSAGAQTACPSPKVLLLVNPTITTLPTGQSVASGGTLACVSLGQGVIGGSPLPSCQAPGVLAVVNATVVGDVLTKGTIVCVSLAGAPVPGLPGVGGPPGVGSLPGLVGLPSPTDLLTTLLKLITNLLGGTLPGGLPGGL
jgi:hypothetical protein